MYQKTYITSKNRKQTKQNISYTEYSQKCHNLNHLYLFVALLQEAFPPKN